MVMRAGMAVFTVSAAILLSVVSGGVSASSATIKHPRSVAPAAANLNMLNVGSQLCLDGRAAKVFVTRCNSDGAYQGWQFSPYGVGESAYNNGSKLCLDGRAAKVSMTRCSSDGKYQQWTVAPDSEFANYGSLLCLDGRASGVFMTRCTTDGNYQFWSLVGLFIPWTVMSLKHRSHVRATSGGRRVVGTAQSA